MREHIDADLLVAARDANKDAFGYLIERYQPKAERCVQRMIGNASIAQELTQEAVLQAYLSLDRLRNDGRFASWLYGITLNVCKSYLRSQKLEVSSLEALMGGMFIDPALLSEGMGDPLAIAEEHEVALGIWIGKAEAFAIDLGLSQSQLPRPMTMNFIASILHSLGAVLEEVHIVSLKDEIFYAIAKIRSGITLHEIDTRPSDAIALAVVTGAPIFVSEEIFDICGVVLPEAKTLHRIDATSATEQSGQPLTEAAPVMEEELSKTEYERNFQHVLRILMQ